MAATLRADVLFGFLIIYLVFYVKKPSFLVPDGVSITVGKEDLYNVESFIYFLLLVTKRERNYKYSNKSVIYLLLLLCGDIETCPGPNKYILACKISSQQRVFLFYIRTSNEWKERRI